MTVMVVGARGYLGGHLLRRLAADGIEAVGLGRSDQPGKFVDLASGESRTLVEHFESASAVVNLAGQLVHNPAAGIRDYFESNVAFADDLARSAVAVDAGLVVHASSRLVYPRTLTEPAVESRDAAPDTPYGLSKLWGEDATRAATVDTNTRAISLRIGQVTGGAHSGLGVVNRFIRQARAGGPITVNGTGAAVRDIVHADDVAGAIAAALCYRGAWTAVNVGGTAPASVAAIARAVANLAGDVSVEHLESDSEDRSLYALDPRRSRDVLGWSAGTTWTDIIAELWARAEEAEQ